MDRVGAVAMLLFGLFWAWMATGYAMQTRDGNPGPGLLPLALARAFESAEHQLRGLKSAHPARAG